MMRAPFLNRLNPNDVLVGECFIVVSRPDVLCVRAFGPRGQCSAAAPHSLFPEALP